jgi:hypothetical protein
MTAVIAGLLLALGAALTTGIASVLQGLAARRAAASPSDLSTGGSISRLVVSPLYLSGVGLDALGFICTVVALHWLPLFLVQCAAASSVGVTALVGRRVLGTVLLRPSVVALSVLGLGLVLLASGAKAQEATAVARSSQWWLVITTAPVIVAGAIALRRAVGGPGRHHAGGILAAISGVSFAGTGVASRILSDAHSVRAVLTAPAAYALAIFGVAGMSFFAAALQRTPVTIATAALFGVETLTASAVGLIALGDSTRTGFVVPSALGFVVTLGSALFLSLNDDEEEAATAQINPRAAVPDH